MAETTDCDKNNVDVFRDTPVRYLGYANEVGESFRSLVHVNIVRGSYVVASLYVMADAAHKGSQAWEQTWPTEKTRNFKTRWAVIDTLLWQGLASVAIPGFTINRICAFSGWILTKSTTLPTTVRKWVVTGIGLGSIPFIIKPIDRSVDHLLESTLRKYYKGKVMETVVHHRRDD